MTGADPGLLQVGAVQVGADGEEGLIIIEKLDIDGLRRIIGAPDPTDDVIEADDIDETDMRRGQDRLGWLVMLIRWWKGRRRGHLSVTLGVGEGDIWPGLRDCVRLGHDD